MWSHQEHHAITKDFLQLNMCLLTMLDKIDALYLDAPDVDASTSVETIPLLQRYASGISAQERSLLTSSNGESTRSGDNRSTTLGETIAVNLALIEAQQVGAVAKLLEAHAWSKQAPMWYTVKQEKARARATPRRDDRKSFISSLKAPHLLKKLAEGTSLLSVGLRGLVTEAAGDMQTIMEATLLRRGSIRSLVLLIGFFAVFLLGAVSLLVGSASWNFTFQVIDKDKCQTVCQAQSHTLLVTDYLLQDLYNTVQRTAMLVSTNDATFLIDNQQLQVGGTYPAVLLGLMSSNIPFVGAHGSLFTIWQVKVAFKSM